KIAYFLQGDLRPPAPQRPHEFAMGDAVQPVAQRSTSFKPVEMAPRLEERLLGEILRDLPPSGEIEQVAEDTRVVLADEPMTGVGVTSAKLGQEQRIRGREGIRSRRSGEIG